MLRILGLVAFLAMPHALHAREVADGLFTLDHVALSVRDLDRSAGFYVSVFGLGEIVNDTEIEGIRWFSLGQGKELHLISVLDESVSLNKSVHFALTTPDFDGFVERLHGAGIAYSNWPGEPGKISLRPDGVRQLYLQDPDGNWVEVNSVASP